MITVSVTVICDNCGDKLEVECIDGFDVPSSIITNEGWEITDAGEHYCKECKEG